jgi:hypothetical protein
MLLNELVASAGLLFEFLLIDKLNLTPLTPDKPSFLQLSDGHSNRSSLHTKHLAQELMRERNDVAFDFITCLEQPTTETRGNVMECVACGRLLDLT